MGSSGFLFALTRSRRLVLKIQLCIKSIATCCRLRAVRSKTGVSTEDNPAYGVSLNTPQKATAIHQPSSAVQEDAVYEQIPI